jgi:hypothetical protein
MAYTDFVLTFSEKNKGWVSFKSFTQMQFGISMANNYYTFFEGELYKHYSENVNRNTFYEGFKNSSLDVMLNDNPGLVKVFNTLNYEGSQSKVDGFLNEIDGTLDLPFQPVTTYSNQEYYNLVKKRGWSVKEIVTDLEEGDIQEFLEKEGKWFNNINRKINITLDASDSGDFTFQGVGEVAVTTINGDVLVPGCMDPTASNYDSNANVDDGSCLRDCPGFSIDVSINNDTGPCANPNNDGAIQWNAQMNGFSLGDMWYYSIVDTAGVVWDTGNINSPFTVAQFAGSSQGIAMAPGDYILQMYHVFASGGTCKYEHKMSILCGVTPALIYGCTNPSASNYNPLATVDNGSCIFSVTSGPQTSIIAEKPTIKPELQLTAKILSSSNPTQKTSFAKKEEKELKKYKKPTIKTYKK